MKTTIIIPNYNGRHFLEDCLAALSRQTVRDYCILIVDNGSDDDSVGWLEDTQEGLKVLSEGEKIPESDEAGSDERYAPVFLIRFAENAGFPAAVNAGIRAAVTDYVILLNNDTVVRENYVEELESAISDSPRAFSVSSKMVSLSDPDITDDAGDLYTVIGWGFQRGVGQPAVRYTRKRRVFAACAGGAIYRRALFDEVGLFDEKHFAYLEDMDVGYRARILGYENLYCPDALVLHVGSGTSGSRYNSFKVKLAARNSVYLNYKNMPLLQLALNAIPLAAGYGIKTVFFIRRGFGADYRAGLKEGLATLSGLKKVKFRWRNLGRYIQIELELIANTFIYAWEFLRRHI